MRSHILRILVMKDLRDLCKNMSALPLVLMAPLLAFLYSKLDIPGDMMFPIWVVYGIAMVGIMLPGMAVAEEKEKKTLDSLLVSPATPHEIIASKVIYTLLMICVVTILVILPYGNVVTNYWTLALASILCAIFFIQIGLIISLFTENQVSANAFMTPVMLIAVLSPILMAIFPAVIRKVLEYLPSLLLLKVLGADPGAGGAEAVATSGFFWLEMLILLGWNVIAYFFTMWGIRRQFD